MTNPFKARLPSIVFDPQSPAVTEAQIAQWRTVLKTEQARLFALEKFKAAFLAVVTGIAGMAFWWLYTPNLGLTILVIIATAIVVIAVSPKPDTEGEVCLIEDLARLNPLEVTAEPEKYVELAQWCAQDAVLAAYQKGWAEQKRLPLAGEYAVIKRWVEGTESRMKKAQMVEQAYAACDVLVGMSVQK